MKTLILFSALTFPGCGGPGLPDTLPELKKTAIESRDAAAKAREDKDPDAAGEAADRAAAALEKAVEILKGIEEPGEDDQAAMKEIQAAARDAKLAADLAEEEELLRDQLTGFKARLYRGGRGAALKVVLEGLALAADQAAKQDLKELPESVRTSARMGATVAELLTGRERKPGEEPDWPRIAADLRAARAETPAGLQLFFAAALFFSGNDGLALIEIESLDPEKLESAEHRAAYRFLRGLLYRFHGYSNLGNIEFRALEKQQGGKHRLSDPSIQAGLFMFLAAWSLADKDYEQADANTVRALRIDPNNFLAVYLTGERLLAEGKKEEATHSLEKAMAGTENEWFAKKIAERTRKVRDSKGHPELIIHDSEFMREAILHYLWEAAKKSEAARRLKEYAESAREFGRRMMASLPGGGAEETEE